MNKQPSIRIQPYVKDGSTLYKPIGWNSEYVQWLIKSETVTLFDITAFEAIGVRVHVEEPAGVK